MCMCVVTEWLIFWILSLSLSLSTPPLSVWCVICLWHADMTLSKSTHLVCVEEVVCVCVCVCLYLKILNTIKLFSVLQI